MDFVKARISVGLVNLQVCLGVDWDMSVCIKSFRIAHGNE